MVNNGVNGTVKFPYATFPVQGQFLPSNNYCGSQNDNKQPPSKYFSLNLLLH
ncbi:hypothetical protein PIROE2DRAFT_16615 [Piromyces sp. E2]|nr:hypothetical protein PIROE2DRAFT_16615 [Piromyces sp. E2]|eukprot:OUM58188.1 hypothetical protein PIROE2DRAFT_16615 [Piromyces sp. E2]